MTFKFKLVIAAILLFLSAYFIDFQPERDKFKDWPVELVQTYSGTSTGKYSHLEFIAVYKMEDGRLIDQRISAATYSQAVIGEKYTINARGMDIFDEDRTLVPVVISVLYIMFKTILWIVALLCSVLLCLPKSAID